MHMERKFKFKRINAESPLGLWEDVTEELWQWEAHYNDGTVLKQFDTATPLPEFGKNVFLFHQFAEIDQSKLYTFKMVSPRLNKEYSLIFNPQRWTLIHQYIRSSLIVKQWKDKKTGAITQVARKKFTAYVFGYKNNVNGIRITNYNVILPSNELVTTDDLSNIRINAKPDTIWVE